MIDLSHITISSTIAELPYHLFQVTTEDRTRVVVERFEQDLQVPAVVVVNQEGLIVTMISRRQFLERMSKPYSLELFTNQPLRKIIPFITVRPTKLSGSTKIDEAARIILNRGDALTCEPIVAIAPDGLRILECNTIFLAQSRILDQVSIMFEQAMMALEWSQHEIKAANLKLIEEIKERQRVEDQLSYNAFHDGLTGLPNRVLFMNRLEQAFRYYQRLPDRIFALMFIDLNRFKLVNDTLGHNFGDLLLVQVGDRLTKSLRSVDTIARLGGDEFAILLDEISDIKEAELCAQRIQDQMICPFDLEGHETYIGASIGIAMISPEYKNSEELLSHADIAMYHSKRQGCYQVFRSHLGIMGIETPSRAFNREFRNHLVPKE